MYNRLRRLAMATYIATRLGSVVNFIGRYNGNWFRKETGFSRTVNFCCLYEHEDNKDHRVKLAVYWVIGPETLLGSNLPPF